MTTLITAAKETRVRHDGDFLPRTFLHIKCTLSHQVEYKNALSSLLTSSFYRAYVPFFATAVVNLAPRKSCRLCRRPERRLLRHFGNSIC